MQLDPRWLVISNMRGWSDHDVTKIGSGSKNVTYTERQMKLTDSIWKVAVDGGLSIASIVIAVALVATGIAIAERTWPIWLLLLGCLTVWDATRKRHGVLWNLMNRRLVDCISGLSIVFALVLVANLAAVNSVSIPDSPSKGLKARYTTSNVGRLLRRRSKLRVASQPNFLFLRPIRQSGKSALQFL